MRAAAAAANDVLRVPAHTMVSAEGVNAGYRVALCARRSVAKTLAKSATSAIGRRVSRWIPGLGAGMGLLHGRKLARAQGEKMHDAIRRPDVAYRYVGPP